MNTFSLPLFIGNVRMWLFCIRSIVEIVVLGFGAKLIVEVTEYVKNKNIENRKQTIHEESDDLFRAENLDQDEEMERFHRIYGNTDDGIYFPTEKYTVQPVQTDPDHPVQEKEN